MTLGGCTAYDVVNILAKKREPLTGPQGPPWTCRKIHMEYVVRSDGLSEKAVHDAIRLSEERYCSVAATLRGAAESTYDYTIVDEM
jgi:putative redox protein